MTLRAGTKLIIHWSASFQPGMAYVMLGRSQRLEDIYILQSKNKFDPTSIKANPEALEESRRLHLEFEAAKREEEKLFTNHDVITYLNVNRLKPHLCHIKGDHILMKSNVLGLGETWLENEETVTIDSYHGNFANYGNGKGLASFIRPQEPVKNVCTYVTEKISAIKLKMDICEVIFLYLSKEFEWILLKTLLDLIAL